MWPVALILFGGLVLLVVATQTQGQDDAMVASGSCPTCRIPMQQLSPPPTEQPPRTWEVLACPSCSLAVPVVQGIPANGCWCPRCQQRVLELKARRLSAQPNAPIRVEVAERCHLCSHEAEIVLEHRVGGARGKVIPFPGRRD